MAKHQAPGATNRHGLGWCGPAILGYGTEEHVILKTSARDFLEKECPKTLVRDMIEDEKGYSPELWRKMAEVVTEIRPRGR